MFMPQYVSTTALLKEYRLKKKDIEKRLKSFETFKNLSEKQLFEELAFCIFTPGSKALNGSRAVAELKEKKLLFAGSKGEIAKALRGIVRFHNNKALYLTEARKYLKKGPEFCVRSFIEKGSSADRRERLVINIKGLGYKEASHFLRNIGLGKDLAILDTHILKNLKRFNVIKNIPVSLGAKQYLDLEAKMRQFSKSIDIPLDALDLLFWSHETGFIYK
jgi:N-glycosylase/DNA lyase